MDGVAVVQVGDVAEAGEPVGLTGRRGVAEVGCEGGEPYLAEALVDHFEQRPDRARRRPWIGTGVDAAGEGQGGPDNAAREGELDVGADAVLAARRRAEARRELLGQPPLDPPCGDGHDLGLHGVLERIGHEVAQHHHEAVGPLGSVKVKHYRNAMASESPRVGSRPASCC